jgi:FKBP-type peptidyl-prolyl cis-trans isomerase FklB
LYFGIPLDNQTMKTRFFTSPMAIACTSLGLLLGTAAVAQTATPSVAPSKASSASEPEGTGPFKTRKDSVSYAVGVSTARNLAKDGVDVDPAVVLKGMQDFFSGGRLQMKESELRAVMNSLVGEMRKNLAANRKEAEEINKKKGDEFRSTFAKQAGVKALPNGILYKVVKAGSGPKPTIEDSVLVNYRGTLASGYEFDASAEGKPVTLKMGQMIMGWREAAALMPTGSRWTIVIPPQLAYGVRGVGADIGPNETLVFDVELVAINK